MEKNNSNIDFSEKDESPYLKYLKEGTKKFYENDFSGSLKLLNTAIRLGCNDRYVFWRRGCAKSRLGDHNGAKSDFLQFGTHLETEYMYKLFTAATAIAFLNASLTVIKLEFASIETGFSFPGLVGIFSFSR